MVEIVALVVSGLSLLIAGVAAYQANKRTNEANKLVTAANTLAKDANKLANEALSAARKSAEDARWFAVQEAVQRLIGFDPASEPIDERLRNLRITMIALVDSLDGWDGLDSWLDAERTLGATVSRVVMETSSLSDTVEQRVTNLAPLMSWGHALSVNLRRFRSTGHDASILAQLQTNTIDNVVALHQRHGWELPPTTEPSVQPLT